jgi:aminopeptidase-like protein
MAMKDLKGHNQEFTLKMQRITRGFDAFANSAVQLTCEFRNRNLPETFLMQVILNAEWDKILNAMVPATEPNTGQLNMKGNARVAVPGEAAELDTLDHALGLRREEML